MKGLEKRLNMFLNRDTNLQQGPGVTDDFFKTKTSFSSLCEVPSAETWISGQWCERSHPSACERNGLHNALKTHSSCEMNSEWDRFDVWTSSIWWEDFIHYNLLKMNRARITLPIQSLSNKIYLSPKHWKNCDRGSLSKYVSISVFLMFLLVCFCFFVFSTKR